MLPPIVVERIRQAAREHSDADACWLWKAAKTAAGYGYTMVRAGRQQKLFYAHRASYEVFKGEIDDGMHIPHSCDTPACFNPKHLRQGTPADNMHDMREKGRGYKYDNCATGDRHGSRTMPEKVLRGVDSPSAKLTEEDVRYIRSSAKSHAALGRELGVTDANISAIRARKTWRHLD